MRGSTLRERRSIGIGAGVIACVCALVALGGCGGASTHATSARLSVSATAAINPRFAACMQRNGLTVLSNGELEAPKTVTPAQLKAVEKLCVLRAAKAARPTRNAAKKLRQSFHGRVVANVVACLHRAGVEVPRSDPALLSSTSGIKTRSPQVKAAIGKCRSESLTAASR